MSLEWQPIYGQCGMCQQPARLEVDLSAHPHLDGKIGVRCTRCGKSSVYSWQATPEGEIARQAAFLAKVEALKTARSDDWQQFHCAMLGLLPQPKGDDAEPWQPDARALTWWKSLRLGGLGPLDSVGTEEEHDHEQGDNRAVHEVAGQSRQSR